jgi:hypothetical protein
MMTPERLKEIREACDGALPGPWEVERYHVRTGSEWKSDLADCDCSNLHESWKRGNAHFIAMAHDAVPELLAEIDRLKAKIRALEDE